MDRRLIGRNSLVFIDNMTENQTKNVIMFASIYLKCYFFNEDKGEGDET